MGGADEVQYKVQWLAFVNNVTNVQTAKGGRILDLLRHKSQAV